MSGKNLVNLISSEAYNGPLTEATARLYFELARWGETSAASVIAKLEGTSVVTIRNRLHAARQKEILDKPGSGVRRL